MKESYNIGFGETDNLKDISKSKSKDNTTASMCNSCDKFHLEECWKTKLKVCYHCRKLRHFIIDCPIKKSDKGSQMMSQSSAGGKYATKPLRKRSKK